MSVHWLRGVAGFVSVAGAICAIACVAPTALASGECHVRAQSGLATATDEPCPEESEYRRFRAAPSLAQEPYCGVQSLFSASISLGQTLSFSQLLRPRFVTKQGSTNEQLIQAAQSIGLFATPVQQLGSSSLEFLPCPTILHMKASFRGSEFNHWGLCLGTRGGDAVIVDGGQSPQLVPLRDLRAIWDGTGILISNRPIAMWPLQLASFLECTLWLTAAVVVFGALRQVASSITFASQPLLRRIVGAFASRSALQAIFLTGIAAGLAVLVPLASGLSFFDSPTAVAGIVDANLPNFLGTVSTAEMRSILENQTAVVVDARWPRDYVQGHMANSINVSPSTSARACGAMLGAIPRAGLIVVYCQSRECPYSEIIARRLIEIGYTNVRLYREGYREWSKKRTGEATVVDAGWK
jgi:rhodanese-related sulfurtransferase